MKGVDATKFNLVGSSFVLDKVRPPKLDAIVRSTGHRASIPIKSIRDVLPNECPKDIGDPCEVHLHLSLSSEQRSRNLTTHWNCRLLFLDLRENKSPVSINLFEVVSHSAGPCSIRGVSSLKRFELLRHFGKANVPLLNIPMFHCQPCGSNRELSRWLRLRLRNDLRNSTSRIISPWIWSRWLKTWWW